VTDWWIFANIPSKAWKSHLACGAEQIHLSMSPKDEKAFKLKE